MKKIVVLLHKSQQLRDIKKKSMIFSPKGRSNVIEFSIHHITKLPKCVIYATLSIIGISIGGSVSALTYSEDVNINFTFNPSLTVSLSSPDIIINNLTPGTSSDSNIIDINVATNNVAGYTLFGTVGNSTDTSPSHNTTSLVHSSNGSTFTSLSTNDNATSLSDFNDNQWGYSYSLDNGTTWSNYSGLPLYSTTGTILKDKHIPGDDSLKFKIAAKSSTTQPSGTYTNTINFTTTANVQDFYFMQDFTNQLCKTLATDNNYTVYDYRDGNDYTVRYINGNCWMTQNLRITGTISAQYSNFTGEDFDVSEYSLDSSDTSFANHCNITNGYSYACSKNSDDVATGAWYNYYAASAGTVATDSNADPATSDICPAGWRLPTAPNSVSDTDFNKLTDSSIPGWQDITSSILLFGTMHSGSYNDGALQGTQYGYWWSAITSSDISGRLALVYNSDIDQFVANYGYRRYYGFHIRCIANN